jgi:hypothetical protein
MKLAEKQVKIAGLLYTLVATIAPIGLVSLSSPESQAL